MTRDFDLIREAFASSLIGRMFATCDDAARAAWLKSRIGGAVRSIDRSRRSEPPATSIRTIALAIAIAAIMQPLLIKLMPMTVAPAMPWTAFALVAVFAGAIAWQAEAVARAWPSSRLAVWLRR